MLEPVRTGSRQGHCGRPRTTGVLRALFRGCLGSRRGKATAADEGPPLEACEQGATAAGAGQAVAEAAKTGESRTEVRDLR